MNLLYKLYFLDHKTRWQAYRCLIGIAFGYGVLMNVVLDRPIFRVAIEDSIIVIAASIAFSWYYCRHGSLKNASTRESERSRSQRALANHPLRSLRKAALVGATITIVLAIPVGLATVGPFPPHSEIAWRLVESLVWLRSSTPSAIPTASGGVVNIDVPRGGTPSPGEITRDIAAPGQPLYLRCVLDQNGCPIISVLAFGQANEKTMALAEPIEGNTGTPLARPRSYMVTGDRSAVTRPAALVLDGWRMRNIIFRNIRVSYKGGETILDNITFSRCSFDIQHDIRGTALARALLRPGPITFRAR
jgi:hypothetical protein